MSDDLVKRLRGYGSNRYWPHGPACDCTQAADRIEELEAKLANASDRIQGLEELLWAAEKDANEAEAYAEELEAKLAKAVEKLLGAAEQLDGYVRYGYGDEFREAVAELTGGNDE